MRSLFAWLVLSVFALGQGPLPNYTLSSGAGAGALSVTVDGMGAYGGCFASFGVGELNFDGGTGPVATTCASALMIHEPGVSAPLTLVTFTDPNLPPPLPSPPITVVVPNREIVATWTLANLFFECRQRVSGPDPATAPGTEGSTLVQSYTVTNLDPTATRSLDFARWLDGDIAPFGANGAGATASLASAGGPLPLTGNGHLVFQYAPNRNFVMMQSMDVVDGAGVPAGSSVWRAIDNSPSPAQPMAAFPLLLANGPAWLGTGVDNDANGDLLVDNLADTASGMGALNLVLQPGESLTLVVRTRLAFLDAASTTPLQVQARDLTRTAFGGSATSSPLLCVNGASTTAAVPLGSPFTVSLALPSGTAGSVYALAGVLGAPLGTSPCAAPRTMDYAAWGLPGLSLGFGAFPLASPPLGLLGTGGGGAPGVILASNAPGLGLLTTPAAAGAAPCGNAVLGPVPTGVEATLTLQSLQADAAAATGISLSNAVTLVIGNCPVPLR